MKLTPELREVLQNFAQINPNLLVDSTLPLGTISPTKTIVAQARVEHAFSQDFGIYDLSEFLSCLSLVGDDVSLNFDEKHVEIIGTRSKVKYFFSRPENLNTSIKALQLPSEDLKFNLRAEVLTMLKKAASTLGHRKIRFVVNNGMLVAEISDEKNKTSNVYTLDIHEVENQLETPFTLDIDNCKFISGDFHVTFCTKGILQFDHTEKPITYWVALEK